MSEENQLEIIQPTALESIQRAEVDIQIATAKKWPRRLALVKQDMLSFATLDQETAESCFYTLPRGGKNIQGPSIRLAEIAISCYGNLRAGSRVVSTVTTGDCPHVVIQSVCHDLEKNVAVTIEKRRRITPKKGKDGARRPIDEDDINLASNAGSAIALRDAVFKVVPLALVKPIFEQAKLVAVGDAKTLSDRRAKALETFAKMGVQKDRILELLEKQSIDEIGLSELETLTGLRNAIKDGEVTIDEAFAPKAGAEPTPTPRTFKPKKQAQAAEPTPQPEPPSDTDTRPESGPVQNLDHVEKSNPAPAAGPGLTPAQERLSEIIQSEGCTFDTLLFICGDPKDGVSAWNHLTKDCASIFDMRAEHITQLLGKEKQLRAFLRTAKEAGK